MTPAGPPMPLSSLPSSPHNQGNFWSDLCHDKLVLPKFHRSALCHSVELTATHTDLSVLPLGNSPPSGTSKCLLSFGIFILSNQGKTHWQQVLYILYHLSHLHSWWAEQVPTYWPPSGWKCVLEPGLPGATTGSPISLPRAELWYSFVPVGHQDPECS